MVETTWESSKVDPEREYVVYAECGERSSIWSYFSMLMPALKVTQECKTAKGAIAFAGRMEFFSKKIVRIAVFEDEKTLMEFAHSGQHAKCMVQFKDVVKAQSAEWRITGSDIPLQIDDAIHRIQSKK
ncbi:MAG: hypothetical protein JSV20_05605 [Candidatus Bathyarchaeota archaeon]|nr:MAG: hypothetical protein JSV20_05605 [Candidatus Bathyarchaeota archaeon]